MPRIAPVVWFALLLALALFLPFLVNTAPAAAQPPITHIDRAGGAYNGIDVTLSVDAAPTPGGTVTLTLTARPRRDAPNVYVQWELPDGGELLDGPASDSLGPVAAGESFSLTRQARFDAASVYEVRAKAFYSPRQGMSLAAVGVLFFDVRDRNPAVSDMDPRTPVYELPPAKRTIDKSHLRTDGPNGRAADGCFSVSGFLTREDWVPSAVPTTPGFFTGTFTPRPDLAVPVHHILVELREEDDIDDDSYGHAITDANGNFRFNFCDDDGEFDDDLELYYRVCAEVRDGNILIASIRQLNWDLYCWDSGIIESDGGNVNFSVADYTLGQQQSAVFNIADALYYAWRFWNDNADFSPTFDRPADVFWQPGLGTISSARTSITIAGNPSVMHEWADSVIIHEWGHFADNKYSCDRNPAGAHSFGVPNVGVNGTRLAWGEGYPDYYQSAARTIMPGSPNPESYIDPNGPTLSLENFGGATLDFRDEAAVASMLWDLFDTTNDGNDSVSYGHDILQEAYTHTRFKDAGDCDAVRYLQVLRFLGMPADAPTAAAISQNTTLVFGVLPLLPASDGRATAPRSEDAPAAASAIPQFDIRWWDQMTMVVDNSSSMAAAGKINTVKTIIGEQVSDLALAPRGTEFHLYTFNDGSATVNPLVRAGFFANNVLPAVNGIAANGPDTGCPVPGLRALSQAIVDKFDGEVWLYTDGDSFDILQPETLRQPLNNQRLRASIVLLGGCGQPARKQSDVTGQERTYLGLAADGSQSSGIVPYLLTALLSGGQFIYVAPDQLANAVDMVRAQLSHTAGAGKWSDYVSTGFTYRWDRLEEAEFDWYETITPGNQNVGQLSPTTPLRVNLPAAFSFYGEETTAVDVFEDGYIRVNPCDSPGSCPPQAFHQLLKLLHTDLTWDYISPGPGLALTDENQSPQEFGPQVWVFLGTYGDWIIITTAGTANYASPGDPADFAHRAYQAWLNTQTGEIRFLYEQLRQEAATAEIGLAYSTVTPALNVIASKNDVSGAAGGKGYQFTPAPPQPSKTYEVEADALIESIIFMQTGYSGTFAPMAVTRPDGVAVNCAAAGVECVTVHNKPGDNMVQYVQVDTNGASGVWKAVVAAGLSGGGTFSFNALAASDLNAFGVGNHTLPYKTPHRFLVDLGRTTGNRQLQGWLQTPAGLPFGSAFTLFDDGGHGDGAAGDGRFGSNLINPPAIGAAYLWVEGTTGGVAFKRSDPVPYNFQPLAIAAAPEYVEGFYGADALVTFTATNQDTVERCFSVDFTAPDGWLVKSPFIQSGICISAGAPPANLYANVSRALSSETLGEGGEVVMTLTEVWEGAITASAGAQVALFRPVAEIEFTNLQIGPLRPNGTDTVELTLDLYDDMGHPVGYSGPFNGELTATNGTYSLPTGMYDNGQLHILFTAGTAPGAATLSALAEGGHTAETTFMLAQPAANEIAVTAAPIDLSNANQSALTVTVLDQYGDPAPGETVRLSVSDDAGDQGTIAGGEVFEGATNKDGQLKATFVKAAGGEGNVVIRAELLGPGGEVLRETSVVLYLSGIPAGELLYLPVVRR